MIAAIEITDHRAQKFGTKTNQPRFARATERRQPVEPHAAPAALKLTVRPALNGLMPTGAAHLQERRCLSCAAPLAAEHIIIYCAEGRGWVRAGGRQWTVGEGDFAVFPWVEGAGCGPAEGQKWTVSWVRTIGANLAGYTQELGLDADRPILRLGSQPQLLFLFKETADALEESDSPWRLFYASQVLGHLLAAAAWRRREARDGKWNTSERIDQSIAHMSQRLHKPIHVASLAALVNMSPSHYRVVFKRKTGVAPMDYFIRLRMEQARRLLEDSMMSVKEIAAALGYDDPFYFSRVFKSVHQVAPREYRAEGRKVELLRERLIS